MPSFNNPKVTNPINSDVSEIHELLKIVAKQDYTGATDLPEGAKRLAAVSGGVQLQKYANNSWTSIGKLMHDVDQLDGHHASLTAVKKTIPVYNDKAQLPGDITGNAATSTKLKTARTIDIGGIASATEQKFDGSGNITIPINSINVANDDDNALVGVVSKAHGGTGRTDGAATDVILSNGGKASEYGQIGEAKNVNNIHLDTIINQGVYAGTTTTFELGYPRESTFQYTIYVSRNGAHVRQTLFLRATEVWCRTSSDTGATWGRWECVSFSTADTNDKIIYISKSGNDSNVGLDKAHPVLTINRALDIAKQVYNPKSGKTVTFCIGEGNWGSITISSVPYYLAITDYSNSDTNTYSGSYPVFSNITVRNCFVSIRNIVATNIQATFGGCIYLNRYIRTSSVSSNNFSYVSVSSTNTEIINVGSQGSVFTADFHSALVIPTNTTVTVIENITLTSGFIVLSHESTMTIKRDNPFTVAKGVTVTGRKYNLYRATDLWVYKNDGTTIETFPGTTQGHIDVGARINGIPYGGGASDKALMGDRNWKPVLLQTGGTITGELIIKPENNRFGVVNDLVTKGTNPSATQYWQVQFADKSGLSSGNTRLGCFETKLGADGTVQTEISAYQNKEASTDRSTIAVYKKTDGTGYATAPTPPASAKSTEIATAAWVNTKLSNYLLTTEGTVNGRINFNLYGTDDYISTIAALNDSNGKRLLLDTYEEGDQGAFLELRKGSDTIIPGGFYLAARNANGSATKPLVGHVDGSLTWDGKHVVRSVNEINANANGNVTVSNISGNAATATKLKTKRTITVQHYIAGNNAGFGMTPNYTGSGSASFDGSGNITIQVPTGSYTTNCNCDNM